MPVFSYAFIQKNDKLYSYLKRKSDNQPFFDLVMFNEDKFLYVDDKNLWEKWKKETSFCESIDTVDFIFTLPENSLLSIPKGNTVVKNGWDKETIHKLLNKSVGKERISGSLDKGITIEGNSYKIIHYSSDKLPDEMLKEGL